MSQWINSCWIQQQHSARAQCAGLNEPWSHVPSSHLRSLQTRCCIAVCGVCRTTYHHACSPTQRHSEQFFAERLSSHTPTHKSAAENVQPCVACLPHTHTHTRVCVHNINQDACQAKEASCPPGLTPPAHQPPLAPQPSRAHSELQRTGTVAQHTHQHLGMQNPCCCCCCCTKSRCNTQHPLVPSPTTPCSVNCHCKLPAPSYSTSSAIPPPPDTHKASLSHPPVWPAAYIAFTLYVYTPPTHTHMRKRGHTRTSKSCSMLAATRGTGCLGLLKATNLSAL